MKKIIPAMAILLVFTFAVTSPVTAGGTGKKTGNEILSQEEVDGLLFMREEEKLAHDVYILLFDEWGLQIFANIAASEQRHTDAVLYLLGTYGLDDPAMAPGLFENPELQTLYDTLVAKGLTSIDDAIAVGMTIELKDIDDITGKIEETDKDDIIQVYTNLLDGSYSHFDAFQSY